LTAAGRRLRRRKRGELGGKVGEVVEEWMRL
jgi:hypothetical protein